jgi:hypothetical protein
VDLCETDRRKMWCVTRLLPKISCQNQNVLLVRPQLAIGQFSSAAEAGGEIHYVPQDRISKSTRSLSSNASRNGLSAGDSSEIERRITSIVHFQRLVSGFRTRRTMTLRPGLKETQTQETQTL